MVWAKLDDEILDNPKIIRAGVFGFALHIAGIAWCARNLTDGMIPTAKVRSLLMLDRVNVDTANPLALIDGPKSMSGDEGLDALIVADHLVECGLWLVVPGGYQVNDYLVYNPSRESVLADRERGAQRAKASRESRKSHPPKVVAFAGSSPEATANVRPESHVGSASDRTEAHASGPGQAGVRSPVAFRITSKSLIDVGSPELQANVRPESAAGSDGPDPDPDPVKISLSRVRDPEPKTAEPPTSGIVLSADTTLGADGQARWNALTMTRKPDMPVEDVWVKFIGQYTDQIFVSRAAVIGRWGKWIVDECGLSDKRRIKAAETRDAGARRREPPPDPTTQLLTHAQLVARGML